MELEEGWIHRTPVRVQFDEVDQYGIVHHTKYFIYFERARVELMGVLGMRADLMAPTAPPERVSSAPRPDLGGAPRSKGSDPAPSSLLDLGPGSPRIQRPSGTVGTIPDGLGLIVAGADVKFRASARFLDDLVVEQGCRKVGASRIELAYRILRGVEIVCTAVLVLAFVGQDGRPCRSPDHIRAGLKRMGEPGTHR